MSQAEFREGYLRALRWAGWGGRWARGTPLTRAELDASVGMAALVVDLDAFYVAHAAAIASAPGIPGIGDGLGNPVSIDQQAGHMLALIRAGYPGWTEFQVQEWGDARDELNPAAVALGRCVVDLVVGVITVVVTAVVG